MKAPQLKTLLIAGKDAYINIRAINEQSYLKFGAAYAGSFVGIKNTAPQKKAKIESLATKLYNEDIEIQNSEIQKDIKKLQSCELMNHGENFKAIAQVLDYCSEALLNPNVNAFDLAVNIHKQLNIVNQPEFTEATRNFLNEVQLYRETAAREILEAENKILREGEVRNTTHIAAFFLRNENAELKSELETLRKTAVENLETATHDMKISHSAQLTALNARHQSQIEPRDKKIKQLESELVQAHRDLKHLNKNHSTLWNPLNPQPKLQQTQPFQAARQQRQ